jgi:hypothetical protein
MQDKHTKDLALSKMRSPRNYLKDADLDLDSLEATVEKALDATTVKKLKIVSHYVSEVGLPLHEACLLARIRPDKAMKLIADNPALKELLEIKALTYKASLLRTLSDRAKDGDSKQAGWLLERMYGEEFSDRAKKDSKDKPAGADNLSIAINFIRQSANTEDGLPVNKKAGKPERVIDHDSGEVLSLGDILS